LALELASKTEVLVRPTGDMVVYHHFRASSCECCQSDGDFTVPQILVIAVLMRSILHRSFNVLQWEALVLLVAGITVNQLNYCTKDAAGSYADNGLILPGSAADLNRQAAPATLRISSVGAE